MKSIILKTLPVLCLAFIFSCAKDTAEPTPPETVYETAIFKTYNHFNEDTAIDWYNGTNAFVQAQPYAFGGNTELEWIEGDNDLTISTKNSENETDIASKGVNAEEGKTYSNYLFGSSENKQLIISENDLSSPATGNIRIKFAHFYQDIGAIDIYIGGETANHKKISNLLYGELSDYLEITSNSINTQFVVTPTGVAPNQVTNHINVSNSNTHEAGKVYHNVLASATYTKTSNMKLFIHE